MTSTTTTRSKKVLVPLAVLLAAGALAVGSGATFTSASSNTIDAVASGTLTHDNDGIHFLEDLDNLKPGDTHTGTLTLTNTGSIDANLTLTQTDHENTFVGDALTLTIVETGSESAQPIFSGRFGGLTEADLGTFTVDEVKDFTFTVALAANADDANQGKAANAAFSWDAIQITN